MSNALDTARFADLETRLAALERALARVPYCTKHGGQKTYTTSEHTPCKMCQQIRIQIDQASRYALLEEKYLAVAGKPIE